MTTTPIVRVALAALVFSFVTPAFAFASDDQSASTEPQPVLGAVNTKRPSALIPLYITAGALQVMDVYTTERGLHAGAVEMNPFLKQGNMGTTIALKVATTSVGILIAEKLWKRNKAAAIGAMILSNAITATVVARNYRAINQVERR